MSRSLLATTPDPSPTGEGKEAKLGVLRAIHACKIPNFAFIPPFPKRSGHGLTFAQAGGKGGKGRWVKKGKHSEYRIRGVLCLFLLYDLDIQQLTQIHQFLAVVPINHGIVLCQGIIGELFHTAIGDDLQRGEVWSRRRPP